MSGALVDKVDSMQEQMDHVSKETEILRTNQNKMLVSKHLIEIRTEIKNECNRLTSRMNTTEEKKISIWEYLNTKCWNWKAKRNETEEKTQQNIQELWGNHKMCNIYIMGLSEEKRERNKRNKGSNNDWELPLNNIRYQGTDSGTPENIKQDICQNKQKQNHS